ncbi:uncharacterized protein CDAR_469391 [Caerostris darwini]|uniref:Ionotropic glutamate receptor L-glutamate and glycine-binding domain-containing protein n=1 Tax=Caerostris darwini TaxID=1538125 RepID=A0AAV4QYA8_9ARAC|nr:uncharacterized protein CDAR_469391 [Caerostris darwini]
MLCPPVIRVTTLLTRDMKVIKNEGDGKMQFFGIIGRLLDTILTATNMQFELIVAEDQEWGRLTADGNWTGMIGKLQRNEADIALHFIGVTEQRNAFFDFSPVFSIDDLTFAIQKPGTFPTSMTFIRPFDSVIWLVMLICLILMPLVFLLLLSMKHSYSHVQLILLGALLRQPMRANSTSTIFRILTSSWLIFALITSFSYSAVLLSLLTVPPEIPVVRNFKELSEAVLKENYKCFVPRGSTVLDILAKHEKEYLRILGQVAVERGWYLSGHPLTQSPQIGARSAIVTTRTLLQIVAGPEEWKNHFLSQDTLSNLNFAIPMRKGFCHKRKLNTLVSRLNSAGLYKQIVSEESFKLWLVASDRRRIVIRKRKPLSCEDLTGAFVSLLINGVHNGDNIRIWGSQQPNVWKTSETVTNLMSGGSGLMRDRIVGSIFPMERTVTDPFILIYLNSIVFSQLLSLQSNVIDVPAGWCLTALEFRRSSFLR